MWDVLLYAMTMYYSHWLIKDLLWPMKREKSVMLKSHTEYRGKEREGRERCQQFLHRTEWRTTEGNNIAMWQ